MKYVLFILLDNSKIPFRIPPKIPFKNSVKNLPKKAFYKINYFA